MVDVGNLLSIICVIQMVDACKMVPNCLLLNLLILVYLFVSCILIRTNFFVGMASYGSFTRPPCANEEDMPDKRIPASLDSKKDASVRRPTCWCEDPCLMKVSTDRKKSWTEGRRFFMCPNYEHDRARPANVYDNPPV